MRHTYLRQLIAAVLAAPLTAAVLAGSADAATYTIRSCDNGSLSGWAGGSGGAYAGHSHSCGASGGGMSGWFETQAGSEAHWTFTAPANTDIEGFAVSRAFSLNANQPYGTGGYALYTTGSGNAYWNGLSNFGGQYYSGVATETASGLTAQASLTAQISCGGGGSCTGSGGGGNGLAVYSATISLRDVASPAITATSGSLLAGGAMRATKAISYSATDQGGGLYRDGLVIDGVARPTQIIDANGGSCTGGTYSVTVPCKLAASNTLALDTTTLTEGDHTVALRVLDATATNATTYGPVAITVDNIPAPTLTSAPQITGTPQVGYTLSADTGAFNGYGVPITFTGRWQRYQGGSWENIPAATGLTYAPTGEDVGSRLRYQSTATTSEGAATGDSDQTTVVRAANAPASDPGVVNPGNGASGGIVNNSTTIINNGQGATTDARLAAVFTDTKAREKTVRYGATVTLTGTITTPSGGPVAGAKLDVSSLAALAGATSSALPQAVTDANGRFALKVRANQSQTVTVAYRANLNSATISQTSAVKINVIPRVTFKTSTRSLHNGQTVALTGQIAGAPAA